MLLPQIGQRIRNQRKKRQLTQQSLAHSAQVSLRFLVQLEAGKGNISVQRLADVCTVLGVTLSELFQGLGPNEVEIFPLVGLRGAGKSTLGPLVAQALGLPFVEVDQRICTQANMELSEIFEFGGSDYYHTLEEQVLDEIFKSGQSCVLAAGGSIVSAPDNWEVLRNNSKTAWLKASPTAHLQRVQAQGDLRPMQGHVDALGKLKTILAAREPFYAMAELTIDTEKLGIAASVQELLQFFGGASADTLFFNP